MSKMFGNQFITCAGSCFNGERINNNPAGVAFDERDVGNVVTANLPHALCNLEQAMVRIQCCMAPQMWVYGVGAVATVTKKLERVAVENESTFGVVDQAALALCNKPTLHAL